MLSLETAKKLKLAGLEWEKQQLGDFLYFKSFSGDIHDGIGIIDDYNIQHWGESQEYAENGDWLFAPRLDQLLAEIEKRGYAWEMMRGVIEVWHRYLSTGCKKFVTETTDEAAALALLWILEQEANA